MNKQLQSLFCISLLLVLLMSLPSITGAQQQNNELLPVIVNLNLPYRTPAGLNANELSFQRAAIATTRSLVVAQLSAFPYRIKRTYEDLPAVAMYVDADGLSALLASPLVRSVDEDRVNAPHLVDSTSLIGSANLNYHGYTGNGQVVAILDTGVDKNHAALQGKVVSEACYSTSDSSAGATNVCPNGQDTTATNSGLPCSVNGCYHGTHVAGIAAASGSSPVLQGVAPGAGIVAIQVFSSVNDVTTCANAGLISPCALAYDSDIAAALQRVGQLSSTYSIAAVNLSLGHGAYTAANCPSGGAVVTAINALAGLEIAVVASSGNSGQWNGIGWPACLSNVIAVGNSTKQDTIHSTSQSGDALDFLAPGSGTSTYSPACVDNGAGICSSVPTNGYVRGTGTSMAAPHVAGSLALIREGSTSITVSESRELLSLAGVPLTDSRNGLTRPRIQTDQAMNTTRSFNLFPEHCHGEYNPAWSAPVIPPSHYELYKSSNSNFTNPVLVYSGTATQTSISVPAGTYLRVRACHSTLGCGPYRVRGPTQYWKNCP